MPKKKITTTKKTVKKALTTKKADGLTLSVYNTSGKITGKVSLPPEIFSQKENPILIAQAVRVYQANQRQGTQSTKTRSMVTGSTRKIYRQKGTGRARHGDKKSPIFIGGGIAHGPHPRDFSLNMPKVMKRKALYSALSSKLKKQEIIAVTGLENLSKKTKEMVAVLQNLKLLDKKRLPAGRHGRKILLVLPKKEENITLASRNIAGLDMTFANLLNTYEILVHDRLLFAKDSFAVLEKTYLSKPEKNIIYNKTAAAD
ncbi:50S ribosomal protein L4 [Candidatus Gottesmanbacteria bacterium]|nr:50S ribosomal protein L4 [Candidatus Gottesmanbacteria bacterium]